MLTNRQVRINQRGFTVEQDYQDSNTTHQLTAHIDQDWPVDVILTTTIRITIPHGLLLVFDEHNAP